MTESSSVDAELRVSTGRRGEKQKIISSSDCEGGDWRADINTCAVCCLVFWSDKLINSGKQITGETFDSLGLALLLIKLSNKTNSHLNGQES